MGLYLRAVTGLSDDVRISERLNLPRRRLRGFESGKIGPVDANDHVGGNYAASLNFQTNLPFLFVQEIGSNNKSRISFFFLQIFHQTRRTLVYLFDIYNRIGLKKSLKFVNVKF